MVYAIVEAISLHNFNILFFLIFMFNSRISGEKNFYITHDSELKSHHFRGSKQADHTKVILQHHIRVCVCVCIYTHTHTHTHTHTVYRCNKLECRGKVHLFQ